MDRIDMGAIDAQVSSEGPTSPAVYIVGDVEPDVGLGALAAGRLSTLVRIPVRDWGASLTPWPAPNPFNPAESFKGEAGKTLAELAAAIPLVERAHGLSPQSRALCGYSLAGLFALWAFASSGAFQACACLSGSYWYEGLPERLGALPFDGCGRYAFLSVGDREKAARRQAFKSVEEGMLACAEALRRDGCQADVSVGPGNHFQHVPERYEAGLAALDRALAASQV